MTPARPGSLRLRASIRIFDGSQAAIVMASREIKFRALTGKAPIHHDATGNLPANYVTFSDFAHLGCLL
jgi:hypothetical protein